METQNIKDTVNFDSLLKVGFAVIDARYGDYDFVKEQYKLVVVRVNTDRDNFYYDMLKSYLPELRQKKDIYELWSRILEHKISMSKILKRDVSIKVAIYDYFETKVKG